MNSEWMTLSQVAAQLGVHPSTVRNWADQKRLPVHRTQGGHRRFKRREIDLWTSSQEASSQEESARVVQSALSYTRFQFSEGHMENEDWYAKLDKQAHKDYRNSGRKLMQGLTASLASDDTAAQAEAHSVGYEYAILGRRHGMASVEAVRAYLFFRSALQEAMMDTYEAAAVHSPKAWATMARKVNSFTDQVLLSLLETYHSLEGN